MASGQKITTFLWFDSEAEAAAEHYTAIFEDGKILGVSRYGEGAPVPAGSVMTVSFELAGQRFIALNGGPAHAGFTEAISLLVNCDDQEEVDDLWRSLSEGGAEGQCGWLKDKFGLSWQIVPSALPRLMSDPDPARAQRVTAALLEMGKIDIARLEAAHAGR